MLVLGRETGQRNKSARETLPPASQPAVLELWYGLLSRGPRPGWQGPELPGRSGQVLNCFLFFILGPTHPAPRSSAGGL